MIYVSLTGLESHMGAGAYADWLARTPDAQGELERCETRLLAAILPAHPRGEAAREAFCRAVYTELTCRADADVPEGVKSFSIGSFSAAFEERPGLSPDARAILLHAGLLYRGAPC